MDSNKINKILDIIKYVISQANIDDLALRLYKNYHNCTILIEYDTYGLFGLGEKKKHLYDTFINIFLPNYLYNNGLDSYFEILKCKNNSYILKLIELNIDKINELIILYKLKGIVKYGKI